MLPWHKAPTPTPESEREAAKAIVALEQAEGWKHFVRLAQEMIQSYTPDIASFSQEQATVIASQMAFISGMKRCLGLVDQQKELLDSFKKKD